MTEYNVDEYKVEGEAGEYTFKISLVDNKINLQLTELATNKRGKNYEGEFTLEELRQINRIFQLTSSIYEAQEEFKKAVERQKIALSENEAYVNIMFHMMLGTDNAPFVIALPRNESARIIKLEQDTDLLKLERDNLFDKLLLIKNNTEEITKSLKEIENENVNLQNNIISTEEEMKIPGYKVPPVNNSKIIMSNNNQAQNDYNHNNNNRAIISNNVNKFGSGIEKNIIKEESEIFFVMQKIRDYLGKNPVFNLLYRASTHGDKANIFHNRCDKSTMTLVILIDHNNNRFGGFTTREWSGNCIQKMDEKAFIFNVEKVKIYEVLPNQTAIGCYPNFGPIFFGCQIRVYDNFFTRGGSTYLKGINYNTDLDYELTNGNQNFGIKDLEVYEVK